MSHTIYIETHGCSLNVSDTELMKGLVCEAGYTLVDDETAADIVVLNTCTVKDRTFRNFTKRLNELNGRKVLVTGCIPPVYEHTDLLRNYAYLGPDTLDQVVDAVEALSAGKTIQRTQGMLRERLCRPKLRRNSLIEIIPISRGCVGTCAYCQTRLARGELMSYPIEQIVAQIHTALEEGVKEVWLTSQDCGVYGRDIDSSLPELLRTVLSIDASFKVRLGMANPDGVIHYLNELVDLYTDPRLFNFLHVPVQSGSDRVLKAMKRRYTIADFLTICEAFYRRYDRFSISTDIIAGFPTETEDDFQQSLDLLRNVQPATINRSRFSPRPFTPAAELAPLHSSIVAERSRLLDRLVKEVSRVNNREWIGWKGKVLIDEKKKPGSLLGRNASYKPVVFMNELLPLGSTVTAEIIDATTYHLIGEVSNPP